jgi:AcrR family transcriptional regulator
VARKPTQTRQKILNTTTNLFSNHGFHATSVEDILSAVGITKGAFYHYFKSKDHLCEVILDDAANAYHQLAEQLQSEQAQNDLLRRWLEMLIEKQLSGQWLYYRLLVRLSIESPELNPSMQNKLKTFWLWCQSFYETLIKKSATPFSSTSINTSELARLYMCAHFGAVWLDRCAPAPQDLTSVCETLLKLSV